MVSFFLIPGNLVFEIYHTPFFFGPFSFFLGFQKINICRSERERERDGPCIKTYYYILHTTLHVSQYVRGRVCVVKKTVLECSSSYVE